MTFEDIAVERGSEDGEAAKLFGVVKDANVLVER